jgi:Family of unknown function (DUF5715)
VTERLASWGPENGGISPGEARRDQDVAAYREAVADVLAELAGSRRSTGPAATERVLGRRLGEPAFAAVLGAVPGGPDAVAGRVLGEIRSYHRSPRSSADNLTAMIRIALLAQIDQLWWGYLPLLGNDADVVNAPDLMHLEALRRDSRLLFNYRLQYTTSLGRVVRSAERRAMPGRRPRTAGLRFPCARGELVVLLNQIAAEFASRTPPGTPRLWVTSLTRSVDYQRNLRALGYAALMPSAHCVGYAADVEMAWFRRFDADRTLQAVLLERQRAGEVNVIDEGQAWHVCVRPGAGRAMRLVPDQMSGS